MVSREIESVIQLKKAAELIKLDEEMTEIIASFDRFIEFKILLKKDDGTIETLQAYRSQHSNALGPYKGGIRFAPYVNEEEVKNLSMWMTWKSGIIGLPYGGGKGGVAVDTKSLSKTELERLSRAYVRGLYEFIGPDQDIPAPDMYTDAQVMAWMTDEYSTITRKWQPAAFTGKPIGIGGSLGREEATGFGGFIVMNELAKHKNLTPTETSIAVQGIGNVGYHFANIAYKSDYRIVAISDSKGGIYNSKGINPTEALNYKEKNGSLSGFPNADMITNDALLELDVDILVPAAVENVITATNADKIKAKYIIELANGPVDPEADEILHSKGIISVPDILANSGGVTVSYFEWVQNKAGYYWKISEINTKLEEMLGAAFHEVIHKSEELNSNLRMGAYALAINKVARAEALRN